MEGNTDLEIEAMSSVSSALAGLDEEAQGRVIRWVADRYAIPIPRAEAPSSRQNAANGDESDIDTIGDQVGETDGWEHFAELYDASGASDSGQGLLVAAYWLQVVQGQESFGSYRLNQLLKELGHEVNQIARIMTRLMTNKPAQIIQIKRSSKAKQARKTYKLTDAGRKTVEQMIKK